MSSHAPLALVLASLTILPLVPAAPAEQVVTGTLLAGYGLVAATDLGVNLLGPTMPATGVDAARIALAQPTVGGEPVTLWWTSDHGADLYLRFYDARHAWIPETGCIQNPGLVLRVGAQSCAAPPGAHYAVVYLRMGALADFEFRYAYEA